MRAFWLGGSIVLALGGLGAWGCEGSSSGGFPAGGAGGMAGGTGTTSTTSAGGSTTTSSGGGGTNNPGGVMGACLDLCAAYEACSPDPLCVAQCVADVSADCAEEWIAVAECASGLINPPYCEFPAECTDEMEQWTACEQGDPVPPDCGEVECGYTITAQCQCFVTCEQVPYDVYCYPSGSGDHSCSCRMDDQFVGSCNGDYPAVCDPLLGCCAEILFGGG